MHSNAQHSNVHSNVFAFVNKRALHTHCTCITHARIALIEAFQHERYNIAELVLRPQSALQLYSNDRDTTMTTNVIMF